jgi:hypothetical protein
LKKRYGTVYLHNYFRLHMPNLNSWAVGEQERHHILTCVMFASNCKTRSPLEPAFARPTRANTELMIVACALDDKRS